MNSVFSDESVDPGNMFRSQPMTFVRLTMHKENQVATIRSIGKQELMHLVEHPDASRDTMLPHMMELRRHEAECIDILKRFLALRNGLASQGLPTPGPEIQPRDLQVGADLCAAARAYLEPTEEEIKTNTHFIKTMMTQLAKHDEFEQILLFALKLASVSGSLLGVNYHSSRSYAGRNARGPGSGGLRGLTSSSSSSSSSASYHSGDDAATERSGLLGAGGNGSDFDDDDGHASHSDDSAVPLMDLRPVYQSTNTFPRPAIDLESGSAAVAAVVQAATIWGIVRDAEKNMLDRMTNYVSHRNVLINWHQVEQKLRDPETGIESIRWVFCVVFPPGAQLPARFRKICTALNASLYDVPPGASLAQLNALLDKTIADRAAARQAVAQTEMALRRTYFQAAWVSPSSSSSSSSPPSARLGASSSVSSSSSTSTSSSAPPASSQYANLYLASSSSSSSSAAAAAAAPSSSSSPATMSERAIAEVLQGEDIEEAERLASPLVDWIAAIQAERAVTAALTKCHRVPSSSTSTLAGWVPTHCVDKVRDAVIHAVADLGVTPAVFETPKPPRGEKVPSRFEMNELTGVFQSVVDTYGVPAYREANPGLFTVVTFPFLFGVMYGDVFHGSVIALFGLLLVWMQDSTASDIKRGRTNLFSMLHPARYMLLMMGLFALYCGIIYNDCASIPLNLFGSRYTYETDGHVATNAGDSVYPFGVDPAWYHTKSELSFFNSMKMKLSVIIGIVHMTFGILLGGTNHIFFKRYSSVLLETIPRLVFLLCTFGYMILLILIKYCIDWSATSASPPNLIQTMINMFLSPGYVAPADQLYAGQGFVQGLLLSAALVAMPILFIGEPLYRRHLHRQKFGEGGANGGGRLDNSQARERNQSEYARLDQNKSLYPRNEEDVDDEEERGDDDEAGEGHTDPLSAHYSFSDDVIHQAIHAIEFVLGAVSNTASYLRLWALSLAHAQLAAVFWQKVRFAAVRRRTVHAMLLLYLLGHVDLVLYCPLIHNHLTCDDTSDMTHSFFCFVFRFFFLPAPPS